MKLATCKIEYLDKAKQLSEDETDRLLSRMGGKLFKRFKKEGLSNQEILGIQMEIEDEQLMEWRHKIAEIRKNDSKKKKSEK